MNVHESNKIETMLEHQGFLPSKTEDSADIIIFNTCTVRNTAEQKIISHLALVHKEKERGRNLVLGIVGCLSQREGVAKDLKRKFPYLDIILGTHNIGDIAVAVKAAVKSEKTHEIIKERKFDSGFEDNYSLISGSLGTGNRNHFINITYGCENYCTYCIVPYVRGKLISRSVNDIREEFKQSILSKPKLVYLLGQNVNSYLCDHTNTNFVELLKILCEDLVGLRKDLAPDLDCQINFMSSHPKDFSLELVDLIASRPEIERNIHLPLQSGSDKILRLMNRKYTSGEYKDKIDYLRKKVPGVRITTDIICGFPGESEEDFLETVNFVKQIKFDSAFVFPYSRRSGTSADRMPDQIDHKTKKRRTTELLEIIKQAK